MGERSIYTLEAMAADIRESGISGCNSFSVRTLQRMRKPGGIAEFISANSFGCNYGSAAYAEANSWHNFKTAVLPAYVDQRRDMRLLCLTGTDPGTPTPR